MEAEKAQREADQQTRYAETAQKAQRIWNAATPATVEHPYLIRKHVPPCGLRVDTYGNLVVPVMDESNKMTSLQLIPPDENQKKRFLKNGKTAGGFYHIPAKDKSTDGPLCIVEGYATGASVHVATGHAVLVAFGTSNLEAVARMARNKYPERRIILCADNDLKPDTDSNPGIEAATRAATVTNALLAVCPLVDGHKADFNDLHVAQGLEAVKVAIEAATVPPPIIREAVEVPLPPEAPLPLRKAPQPQEAYPVEALGIFAEAVEVFAHATKTPVSMSANGVLSALSLGAQAIANVETRDGRSIPLSLYALTVAESGDRKSALDNVVLYAVQQLEKQKYLQYQTERKAYDEAKRKWDALPKKERDTTPFDMEEPQNTAQVIENTNSEGAFRQLKEGAPSVAFFSNEAGTLFGGQAYMKDNVLKSITFFSSLWDGKSIDKLRAGEGFSRLYNRRACAHFMLQPVLAEKILADELLLGQGFLARFLVAWPATLRGTRIYESVNVRTHHAAQTFYAACEQLLQMPPRVDAESGGLILDSLCLADNAHAL